MNIMEAQQSEFKTVFSDVGMRDGFYRFLQVIFHLYPEDKFHYLITETSKEKNNDEEIYRQVQSGLPSIKPFLSELTYALPALKKQKREITRQTLQLLNGTKRIHGYLEIGSTGRYISELRKRVAVEGDIYLINDISPSNSIGDIFERGRLRKLGTFIPLRNYQPISREDIPDNHVELVTCYIGLHHAPVDNLLPFLKSIHRILKPGGRFILRDHDVKTPQMSTFVSLVHTVFNLGLNMTWEDEAKDFKSFRPIDEWSAMVCSVGFTDSGQRILQDKDPSDNTLLGFTREG